MTVYSDAQLPELRAEIERLRRQLAQAWPLTDFERTTLAGFVYGIANDGLDTYGLSGAEKAAIGRALDKLRVA